MLGDHGRSVPREGITSSALPISRPLDNPRTASATLVDVRMPASFSPAIVRKRLEDSARRAAIRLEASRTPADLVSR
jgi:hypothetical protein